MKQNATRRTTRVIKQPARGASAQHEEYGHTKPGIIICPNCGNVHYHKRWWKNSDKGLHKLVVLNYRTAARTLCPACTMIEEHLFEGEVLIENVPAKFRTDVTQLIKNFGNTATDLDPQDRIISVLRGASVWRITTTENQLADRLAKAIRDTFKTHAKIHISHSKEPYEVDRVRVVFSE
jgi:NMD protein affecting ribosome stability and mRNA decay